MKPDARERPAVSVVLPFLGTRAEAAETLRSLAAIERRAGDEILVVDNSVQGAALGLDGTGGARVVAATVKRSAYAARNQGAELARSDWVLFLDADCRPTPGLLDQYFSEPIDEACGALAGEIVGAAEQRSVAARYGRIRLLLSDAGHRDHPYLPAAPTANLLVRKEALVRLGGFPEGMTAAGGDIFFSWRLQEVGWKLCFRSDAVIEHRHRETIRGLIRQTARDAAGAAWLNRIYPGALPAPSLLAGLGRSIAGAPLFALTGQLERSQMKLMDGIVVIAQAIGYRQGHGTRRGPCSQPARTVVVNEFPRRGDEAIASLWEGGPVRVEAVRRARDPDWKSARGIDVRFWEDEGTLRSLRDAAWLLIRHPVRVIADHWRSAPEGADRRLSLRRLAPAARRIAAGPAADLFDDGTIAGTELCQRLARLSGTSGDRRAVADRPAQNGEHLDHVVQHEIGDHEDAARGPGHEAAP
jgi:GT2 family glycosyltransferase